MEKHAPVVVKIHDVNIDQDYAQWISEIKARYRKAQIKASIKVNVEQLNFNWQLGRDLVTRKAEERWGAGVVEQLSLDLRAEFPESKGFSTTNLWRMKQWYLNGKTPTSCGRNANLLMKLFSTLPVLPPKGGAATR